MTKADLIEEVSGVVEMTRKESEVIVESILDSSLRPCTAAIRSRSGASAFSARAVASLASGATRRLGLESRCLRRRSTTSSLVKN